MFDFLHFFCCCCILYLLIGVCVCGRILEGVGAFCLPFVILKENKDFLKQVEEWEAEEAEREKQHRYW